MRIFSTGRRRGTPLPLLLGAAVFAVVVPAQAENSKPSTAAPAAASTARKEAAPKRMRDLNAKKRAGLIVGGSILFGVSYGLPCAGTRGVWCVPFAGPFLAIAQRSNEDSRSTNEDGIVPPVFVYTVLGMVSFLQLGGAALITGGVLLPRREVETASRRVTLLPLLTPSTAGLVAVGTL